MYEFRFLLDRFWVTRAENKDLYFAVKRQLPHYRRLANEQLGWNLIVNEAVVKLEKVPAKAKAWWEYRNFKKSWITVCCVPCCFSCPTWMTESSSCSLR